MFSLASCEKEPAPQPEPETNPLATPVLSIAEQTETAFTISWEAVENAAGYTYIFQEEASQTTTETSVSFSDLKAGKYTVKVKANAPADSEFTDSKYAEIAVTIEEALPEDWFTQTVFTQDSPENNVTSYNSIFVSYASEDVKEVRCIYAPAATSSGMSDEEVIAAMDDKSILPADFIDEINSKGGITLFFKGLEPNTEYEVMTYATHNSGATKLLRDKATTAEVPELDPDAEKWLGEWTVTSTQTLVWAIDGQYLAPEVTDEPMTFDVRIEANEENLSQLLVWGWCHALSEDVPALAQLDENKNLAMMNLVQVGNADDQGFVPTWCAVANTEKGVNLITGDFAPYTFALDGETAESTAYEGELNDGSTFKVVNFEIYALSQTQYSVYGSQTDFPLSYPAGNFTMTKKASSTRPCLAVAPVQQQVVFPTVFANGQAYCTAE